MSVTLPLETLIFWMVTLNVLVSTFATMVHTKIPSGRSKKIFLIFLAIYAVWANSLFAVQVFNENRDLQRTISQGIFASGALFIAAFGHFLVVFADPRQADSVLHRLLTFHLLLIAALSFCGVYELGVRFDPEYGPAPIEGEFLPHYNASLLIFGVYALARAALGYRREASPLMRVQLRIVLFSGLPSFTAMILANAVVPGVFGNYALTPAGGLWLLLFFAGISFIVLAGERLLLFENFKQIAESERISNEFDLLRLSDRAQRLLEGSSQTLLECGEKVG